MDNCPLCVDLDGTLIRTDSLAESIVPAIKVNPLLIFLLPFFLLRGRAFLKAKVVKHYLPDPELLPYNEDVLDYIKQAKADGREIVLATATNQSIADTIASYLVIFDKVLASSDSNNLRSENKRKMLSEIYGEKGYDYIGNSNSDIAVWKSARKALIVSSNKTLIKSASKVADIEKIFEDKRNVLKLTLKEIRVYQWIKNVLIFLPFLLAHKLANPGAYINTVLAFFSFSLVASHVYLINDLMDLESDRHHPRKRRRPLASGDMPLPVALMLAPLLLLAGLGIAFVWLNHSFLVTLILYFVLTSSYSFYLKRLILVDVIALSMLYTLRLLAGAYVASVPASPWLLGFSIFFFLSLAIVKRFTELNALADDNKNEIKGRAYLTGDLSLLSTIGPAAGYMSVLVLALYVNSKEVTALYSHPEMLWLVALLVIYWISRIWLFAHRGKMHDDPIIFAAKDKVSYFIGLIVILLVISAALL